MVEGIWLKNARGVEFDFKLENCLFKNYKNFAKFEPKSLSVLLKNYYLDDTSTFHVDFKLIYLKRHVEYFALSQ